MKKFLYKDLYEQEENHWWHIAKRALVKSFAEYHLSKKSKNKILDVGCGTGKNIESLQNFGEVWGIDYSPEAIKFCKKRGLKKIKLGKAEKTAFPKNSFHLITLLDVLEHVDDKKTLIEVKRILKSNGLVIITVPAYPKLWSKWDEILNHKRRYTKASLKTLLKHNDFKVLNLSYMHSYLLPWHFIIRPIKSILQSDEYSSDFNLDNHFWNLIGRFVTRIERPFIKRGLIPFGLSLMAIAKKK
ncbi:class I SAM-dependent methyltransferase [Patescibacteria group bacterium]|nr:class I SAM-dependent methyltransferase [Patescibacteria group bacterium]